jgi:hypothetical protein
LAKGHGALRSPVFRSRKYDSKMDADVIRSRFLAQRNDMVEQETAVFAELTEMERKAKILLNHNGVSVIQTPMYLDFVRQCYRIGKRHAEKTRVTEVWIKMQTWLTRGLNSSILSSLALLCGTDITQYGT